MRDFVNGCLEHGLFVRCASHMPGDRDRLSAVLAAAESAPGVIEVESPALLDQTVLRHFRVGELSRFVHLHDVSVRGMCRMFLNKRAGRVA